MKLVKIWILSLLLVSIIPVNTVSAAVTITIDSDEVIGTNNLASGFMLDTDIDRWLGSSTLRNMAEEADFKLIRFKSFRVEPCTRWYTSSRTGNFDWRDVDRLVESIFAIGAEPIIVLGDVGSNGMVALPTGMTKTSTGLPNPTQWAAYSAEWVKHFKQVGLPVKYYEIVNEPQHYFAPGSWANPDYSKLSSYKALYDATYTKMHQENNAIIASQDFIMHKTILNYWLDNGGVVDSLNFHKYDEYRYPYLTDAEVLEKAEEKFFGKYPLGGNSITEAQQTWYNEERDWLPIICSESNMNSKHTGGTDPRIQTMVGATWLALTARMEMLAGVSYHVHYAYTSSKSYATESDTGGYGFGLINKDNNEAWYPYYVNYMIGRNQEPGDQLVESRSSSSNVRVVSWINGGKLITLLISKTSNPVTVQFNGLQGQLDIQYIDDTISYVHPSMQSKVMNAGGSLYLDGYTVAIIESDPGSTPPPPPPPPPTSDTITMDNDEAVFDGNWPTSQMEDVYWGDDYNYHSSGTGSNTATWTFSVEQGDWEVYAWWSSAASRATDTPYTINHAGGSSTVRVNQETDGSEWNSLGEYSFNTGSYSVEISDDANDVVVADAIRLVKVDTTQPPPPSSDTITIDNNDATFDGSWPSSRVVKEYYGTNYNYNSGGSGSDTATWTFSVDSGTWEVYAWWTSGNNRATNAPYTINYLALLPPSCPSW